MSARPVIDIEALLFFPKLDLNSGTAQLLKMQANGLRKAGARVIVACERGGCRFFVRTGIRVQRKSIKSMRVRTRRPSELLVDHSLEIPDADVVFVHNLSTEASRFLARDESSRVHAERAFFSRLRKESPIVANSALVKSALTQHFALAADRIVVHHPGFDAERFCAERREALRAKARTALGIDAATPLVGFVTSGDLHKRGVDLFLAAAERMAAERPDLRFLIVGARSLPDEWAAHPLFALGTAFYRPKNHHPEQWIAALDLFMYAARFEEFGMVVLEAMALGVPVLTSRRVGAAECLPSEYAHWIADEPLADALATRGLGLMADAAMRASLARVGVEHARAIDGLRYGEATAATILRTAGSSTG